jgi:hypothetical protein
LEKIAIIAHMIAMVKLGVFAVQEVAVVIINAIAMDGNVNVNLNPT